MDCDFPLIIGGFSIPDAYSCDLWGNYAKAHESKCPFKHKDRISCLPLGLFLYIKNLYTTTGDSFFKETRHTKNHT